MMLNRFNYVISQHCGLKVWQHFTKFEDRLSPVTVSVITHTVAQLCEGPLTLIASYICHGKHACRILT